MGTLGDEEAPTFSSLAYLRNLYGFSTGGLRLYEKAGLAHFKRDSENNYRRYTVPDVVLLCNAVDYTHYGFTLRETSQILLEDDLAGQLAKLEEMDGRLFEQIEDLLAKKRRLEEERAALALYLTDPLSCAVRTDLDVYQLPIHSHGIEMGEGLDDSGAWWHHAPFVTTGMMVELDGDEPVEALHGPVADGREVRRLDLPVFDAVRFCAPGQACLRAFARVRADEVPRECDYTHIWEFMRREGWERTSGRALHRLLRFQADGGVPMRLDEVLVTVRRAGA